MSWLWAHPRKSVTHTSFAMAAPRVDAAKVKVGEFLALHNYYKATGLDAEYVHVTDQNGLALRISRSIVNNSMSSTTQYTHTEKVTRTRLAQIIEGAGHAAFCVWLFKQVVANEVGDGLDGKDLSSQAKRRKVVKELMKGEARTMHARLWRSNEDDVEMELGRFKVVDLEKSTPGDYAQRLVDTRTIWKLVIEGKCYHTGATPEKP